MTGVQTCALPIFAQGIIPRALVNYGLPDCLRFSVGLEQENRAVIAALAEFFG